MPSAETMTTLTSAYILRDAEGAVWVAEVPTGQEPGGVMPRRNCGFRSRMTRAYRSQAAKVRSSAPSENRPVSRPSAHRQWYATGTGSGTLMPTMPTRM